MEPNVLVLPHDSAPRFVEFWQSLRNKQILIADEEPDNHFHPLTGHLMSFKFGIDVETSRHINVPLNTIAVLMNRNDIADQIAEAQVHQSIVTPPTLPSDLKDGMINLMIEIISTSFSFSRPRVIRAMVRGFAINISDILDGPVDDLAAVRTQPYSFNEDNEPQRREEETPTFTFGSQLNLDEMGLFSSAPPHRPAHYVAPERTTGDDSYLIQQFWRSNTTAAASPWISRVQPL